MSKNLKGSITIADEALLHLSDTYIKLIHKSYDQDTTNLSGSLNDPKSNHWQCILDSVTIQNTLGYYGQAWINKTTKQIVIVNAGTKFNYQSIPDPTWQNLYGTMHFIKDLVNDFHVALGTVPYQFKYGAKHLTDQVINKLKSDPEVILEQYSFHSCGHSLGAILSDLLIVHVLKEYPIVFKETRSLTIENPGSHPAVTEYLAKEKILDPNFIKTAAGSCVVIQGLENWINTTNKQFGYVLQLNCFTEQKPNSTVVEIAKYPEQYTNISPFFKSLQVKARQIKDEVNRQLAYHDKDQFLNLQANHLIHVSDWKIGHAASYITFLQHPILMALSHDMPKSIYDGVKAISYCWKKTNGFLIALGANSWAKTSSLLDILIPENIKIFNSKGVQLNDSNTQSSAIFRKAENDSDTCNEDNDSYNESLSTIMLSEMLLDHKQINEILLGNVCNEIIPA